MSENRLLHVIAHPDDTLWQLPGTVTSLIDEGWEVQQVVCAERGVDPALEAGQLAALEAANDIAGIGEPMIARADFANGGMQTQAWSDAVSSVITDFEPRVVISDDPFDDGMERHSMRVANGVLWALRCTQAERWLVHGVRQYSEHPTVYMPIGQSAVRRVADMARAYSDGMQPLRPQHRLWSRAVIDKMIVSSVRDQEKVQGYGSAANPDLGRYGESAMEVVVDRIVYSPRRHKRLAIGEGRILDFSDPFPDIPTVLLDADNARTAPGEPVLDIDIGIDASVFAGASVAKLVLTQALQLGALRHLWPSVTHALPRHWRS